MSSEAARQRWQRVKSVLAEALEQPVAERDGFVRQSCADDEALRGEVERLLQLHNADTISLEYAPAISSLAQRRASMFSAGETIGAWTLQRELGRGGMGSVWLAQRADPSFRQLAAVKVIRGVASERLLERLRGERHALAALSHPNIAHLVDGGETPGGMPYIVMEYVDGQSIDVWCENTRLTVAERLQLMMQLVAAVAHAHEHLLVHRDIKPSNVLVTPDGQVKLLDFGVAKLLAPEDDGRAATQWNERALTPEYASPEQVQGRSITVATDVYGLAATLYRMLTGVAPMGSVSHDPFKLLKAVVEEPPLRASVALRSRAVGKTNHDLDDWRSLRGDLDTILIKALEKNPADRYATVLDFGRDLKAYLDGYPIAAQRPTWSYVARKFVARNRVASGAMAMGLLSLVAGLGGALYQANQATQQRDLARSEQERATAALGVAKLESERASSALLAEQQQRTVAMRATAQAEVERSAAQAAAASAAISQRQAEVQRLLANSRFAEVRSLANRVVSEYADDLLGTYGTAETRLKIINDSVRFLDRLRTEADHDPGLMSELSHGYRKLAFALSGDASLRDFPRAGEQLAHARRLREQVIKARGLTPEDVAERALLDSAEGELARQQYQFATALAGLARARTAFANLRDWKTSDPWDRVGPSRAAVQSAYALIEPGTNAETRATAAAALDDAQVAAEQILASAPSEPIARFHLSEIHSLRALLARQTGKFDAASVAYDQAERLAGDLVNQFPNNSIYVQHWSNVLGDRKTLRLSQGLEQAGFADGIKRAELASTVRAREPADPQAILSDLGAWSGLCSDYLRLEKAIAVARLPCQHALESARAMLAVRQIDPYAAPAYQAMIVAGLAGVQEALASASGAEAVAAALRTQEEGLAGITRLTPPVTEDPLRTAYLVNTRISVAQGLELAGHHDDATRLHRESLDLITSVRKAKIDEVYTPALTMFTYRRMAHNFLAQSRQPGASPAVRSEFLGRSVDAAQSFLAVAMNARSQGRLSPLFAGYVPEMEQMANKGH